jgi:transcriptional regulator with XRE-family HTH domain
MLMHRLRRLRLQRGWNVEELARQAGVSRTTMYLLETGKTAMPRAKTLQQIAATLGVEVEELAPEWASALSAHDDEASRSRSYDRAINKSLNGLVDRVFQASPQLFGDWSQADWDELYSTYGVRGALTEEGISAAAEQINRKRTICHQLQVVLETEHAETAARVIQALYQLATTPPMLAGAELPCDGVPVSGTNSKEA